MQLPTNRLRRKCRSLGYAKVNDLRAILLSVFIPICRFYIHGSGSVAVPLTFHMEIFRARRNLVSC